MDLAIVEREVGFTSSNSKQREEKEQQSERNRSEIVNVYILQREFCIYSTSTIAHYFIHFLEI